MKARENRIGNSKEALSFKGNSFLLGGHALKKTAFSLKSLKLTIYLNKKKSKFSIQFSISH